MITILKALYREPVLFNGFTVAILAGLSAAEVIPVWIGAVAAAGGAVLTRRYTRPDRV
jgi:hypothetical protein